MSEPSRSPSPVELEPVTCWPLIAAAVGFVSLGVLTVGGFAAWSALFPPPRHEAIVAPVQGEKAAPVQVERIDLPAQPLRATTNDRVVKVRREVIRRYTPSPRPPQQDRTPPAPPQTVAIRPAAAGISPRLDDVVVPTYLRQSLDQGDVRRQLWKHGAEITLDADKDANKQLFEAGLPRPRQEANTENAALPPITKTIEDLLKGGSDLRPDR